MAEPAEMVEVVIRLPKEIYERTLRTGVVEVGMDSAYIGGAVIDGTVLPKGHGRLVDEKDLSLMTVHLIDGVFVCTASTIIEADKTESEDKNDSTRDGIEE